MDEQTAVPSSRARTRVVAIVKNGAVWSILATPRGLVSCLGKYQGDLRRHVLMPSLQEFTQMINAIEVLLPDDPNSKSPELTRSLSPDEFWGSGEDLLNTGSSVVRHVPGRSNQLAAKA